jgi:restriction system protein
MTWPQFERLIGESFRRRGYEVTEAGGGGGDGGVDLLLAREGESFLVQCKHWRTRRVGVSTIRELNGVIAARHAAGGFVITSGQFTPRSLAICPRLPDRRWPRRLWPPRSILAPSADRP